MVYELVQPNGEAIPLTVGLRCAIGLVKIGGDDRNDRDLRLVYGSALDRLLSDKSLRAVWARSSQETRVGETLHPDAKERLQQLDKAFREQTLPEDLGLGLSVTGMSVNALIGLTAAKDGIQLPLTSWDTGTRRLAALEIAAACQGECPG